LHVGSVIEGPIGTEYKVDASYISPSINKTVELEELTKEFLVNIILSNEFVTLLPKDAREKLLRRLHSEHNHKIYTVDIFWNRAKSHEENPKESKRSVRE